MYNHPTKVDNWTEVRQLTYHKGFVAGKIRQPVTDNPFDEHGDDEQMTGAACWADGWTDAQRDRLS